MNNDNQLKPRSIYRAQHESLLHFGVWDPLGIMAPGDDGKGGGRGKWDNPLLRARITAQALTLTTHGHGLLL